MRLTRFASVLVTSIAISALGLTMAASAPSDQQAQPVFGAHVDLIQIDASVLDKNDRPVRGLDRSDFVLIEDGGPQTIQAFIAVDLPGVEVPTARWLRDVSPDALTNTDVEADRLVVVFMDGVGLPRSDLWPVQAAKSVGRDVVAHLGAHDLAAVLDMHQHSQEFTHDRSRLLAAVDQFDPGNAPPHADLFAEYLAEIRAVRQVVESLASVPDRRKTLVWVSTGIPLPMAPVAEWYQIYNEWTAMLRAARVANVNIFPIDPTGLSVPDGGKKYLSNLDQMGLQHGFALATAANTGGHAFLDSNEFASKVDQIFRETGSFYLLGYVSSSPKADGKFHRLDVKVNRPGMTVHTRAGYYAADPPDATHLNVPSSPAIDALVGLVPKRDLPLTMTVAPFGAVGVREQPVSITVGLGRPSAEEGVRDVDVVVEVFTFDGARQKTVHTSARVAASRRDGPEQSMPMQIDLPPGRYQVRVAANVPALGKAGSVYADLDVPDFAKSPLSLSGVVVSTNPAAVSASPLELLPIEAATTRSFAVTDHVNTFLRLYQGGGRPAPPVVLATRIVNDHDIVAFTVTETLTADQFGTVTHAVDHPFALPLVRLAPGEYLLTFEATMGKATARRDVRFAVR